MNVSLPATIERLITLAPATLCCLFCGLLFAACNQQPAPVAPVYQYIAPQYSGISLHTTADTIHFALDDHTYNQVKSYQVFAAGNRHFIAFHDQRSQSIVVYDFASRALVKKISIKKLFPNKTLYKTKMYVRNFDSIFITNQTTLYLFDSAGTAMKSIDFADEPRYAWASPENTMPPVLRGNTLYTGVSPYVEETSLKALRKWRVLYAFDLDKEKPALHYALPALYRENLYGYHFLDYTYCVNDRGHFVWSFPADTNLYETDLRRYHRAYYAKSRRQSTPIAPVSKQALENDDGYKQYRLRDSYGAVLYDALHKRYLRLVRHKLTEPEFAQRKSIRKETILIFDEHFRIIGESEKEDSYYFNSIFFGPNGAMYARVDDRDEYAIHFVKLAYSHPAQIPVRLSSNR